MRKRRRKKKKKWREKGKEKEKWAQKAHHHPPHPVNQFHPGVSRSKIPTKANNPDKQPI